MSWVAPIAGLASSFLGKKTSDAAGRAAGQGFEYLKNSSIVKGAQAMGAQAGEQIQGMLGLGGQEANEEAFSNFQNSSGFQFRLGQGMDAITGSRAAKGVLNSGAAAKELTQFGQNLGSQEFGNYMSQLRNTQSTGLGAASNVASAGASAGSTQAKTITTGGQEIASGLGVAAGGMSDMYQQKTGLFSRNGR